MVDAYKLSRDVSLLKLDELFYEFELYEKANLVSTRNRSIFDGRQEEEKEEEGYLI